MGITGGGALEKYLGVGPLKPFINMDNVLERFVDFRLPEVEGLKKRVAGLPADLMIDVCRGMVAALEASNKARERGEEQTLTARQADIAIRASMFLAACAKVGLEALIDEATGYQYERAEDALQVKLRAYLEEEMRKWERTFYLIDENGKAWCVEYYGITERERWKKIVHPDDLVEPQL